MLSAPNWQPVQTKVPNHVRYCREGPAKLAQDELARFVVALYSHVHESFCAPTDDRNELELEKSNALNNGICRSYFKVSE